MCDTTNIIKRIMLLLKRVEENSVINTEYNEKVKQNAFYKKIFESRNEITDEFTFIRAKMDYLLLIDQGINITKERYISATKLLTSLQGDIAQLNLKTNSTEIANFKSSCKDYYEKLVYVEETFAIDNMENVIKDEDLEKISLELNNLIDEIKESRIDSNFKVIILKNLNDLKFSIEKYSILGVDGIRDEVYKLTGAVFNGMKNIENVQEEEKNFVKKILALVENTNGLVEFGKNVIQIGATATPMLMILDKIFS